MSQVADNAMACLPPTPPPLSQRLVEAAEEAHHQHEENPDLQVQYEHNVYSNTDKTHTTLGPQKETSILANTLCLYLMARCEG